jgi:membrane-bound inhibitor of C-type lysozyme
VPQLLRTEQRGWVKGRDECWKAKGPDNPVYLTESWIATDLRGCVEGHYRLRISEPQAKLQLVPAKEPVVYTCDNPAADRIVATFFETDLPAARVERGDRTVTAWLVRTASGAKYEGQNMSLRTKADEAMVTWMGEEMTCRAK